MIRLPTISLFAIPSSMIRSAAIAAAVLGSALLAPLPALAVEIERVVAPDTGVEALLVEDRANPIVTLRVAFPRGALIERQGEEGLVNLLSTMLDEGAGDLDAAAFQDRLDRLGVRFSASSGPEGFRVGVSALEDRFPQAVELLADALGAPRFDPEPLARMKRQVASSLHASRATPRAAAGERVRGLIWGDHPYSRSADGEPAVIEGATADDLRAVANRLFVRDGAAVAAVGAIDGNELADAVDRVFAALPDASGARDVPPAEPALGLNETLRLPGAQASIRVVLPAPRREDDDFFAAYLVNHILGGGSFTSRLYSELREERGLTYGASSGIRARDAGATWTASVSTRPENTDVARDLLLGEIERMALEGPTAEELAAAKAFVSGSYAINNLDSSGAVAGVLLGIQENDLGLDYIDRREGLIDAVTLEDARRVAARYLGAEPTVITVVPDGFGEG